MTGHALRTLVKQDHAQALSLLGYPLKPSVTLSSVESDNRIAVGEAFNWSGELHTGKRQNLKILLKVYYVKSDGSHQPKAFGVKDVEMAKGETLALQKRLPFRPMTTRALYPGRHLVELVVNGQVLDAREFDLVS